MGNTCNGCNGNACNERGYCCVSHANNTWRKHMKQSPPWSPSSSSTLRREPQPAIAKKPLCASVSPCSSLIPRREPQPARTKKPLRASVSQCSSSMPRREPQPAITKKPLCASVPQCSSLTPRREPQPAIAKKPLRASVPQCSSLIPRREPQLTNLLLEIRHLHIFVRPMLTFFKTERSRVVITL